MFSFNEFLKLFLTPGISIPVLLGLFFGILLGIKLHTKLKRRYPKLWEHCLVTYPIGGILLIFGTLGVKILSIGFLILVKPAPDSSLFFIGFFVWYSLASGALLTFMWYTFSIATQNFAKRIDVIRSSSAQ